MNNLKQIFILFFLCNYCVSTAINDPKYPFHPTTAISFESSNLPIVIIDLDERMANKEEDRRVSASMKIVWKKNGEANHLSDTESYNYNGKIGIKYRGNSSYWNSEKKPFGIRTQDSEGKKQKASILGMGKDDDWALLAPFNDKSLIRDVLIYELMRGSMEYVPEGKYCELILNGVYQGIYIMAARVRQGSNRINMDKPSGDEGDGLTGGYHLEIDRSDEPGFRGNVPVKDLQENDLKNKLCTYYQYKYPDQEDLSEIQKEYIRNLIINMENAIAGNDFKNPDTGYRAYLDTLSLMDFYIAQELGRNVDGYRLSTPLYKYPDSRDKHFRFSIWDFNLAFGNANYMYGWSTEGWSYNFNRNQYEELPVPWMFKRILQDEVFCSNLGKRWSEYRLERLTDDRILNKIDSLTNLLQEAQERNFSVWNRFNKEIWPNYYIASSWKDEIDFIKKWVKKRTLWLDSQWCSPSVNKVVNAGFEASEKRGYLSGIWLPEWETSGNGVALSENPENIHSGNYALSLRSNNGVSQIITELTPGKYTLKVWVRTQGDPLSWLYLRYHQNRSGSDQLTKMIEDNKPYHLIEIRDIEVSNNFAEIGFKTSTRPGDVQLWVDEIEFFKQPETTTGIHPLGKSEKKISIKTNPSDRSIQITTGSYASQPLPVEIFHISGNKVYKGEMTQPTLVVTGIFSPASIYIVKVGGEVQKILF